MTHTLGVALLDALVAHGARALFGIPGDFVLPLFRTIRAWDRLPVYGLAHEPAVGFAADAAARVAHGLGVAIVTYGAGALNMVNPMASAWAEHSPLVVVSGAPGMVERRRGLLLHHQVKSLDTQRRIMVELSCDHAVLDDPATAPQAIARVLRSCREASRPVYLELPRDLVDHPCAPVEVLPPTASDPARVRRAVALTLESLLAARRPVVLVDVDVRRFELEGAVQDLARHLGLPIATTFMGRGLCAGSGGALVGTWLGRAGDARVASLVEEADLVLGLGLIHSDVNLLGVADAFHPMRLVDARDGFVACAGETLDVPLSAFVHALVAAAAAHPARPARAWPAPPDVRDDATPEAAPTPDDVARAIDDLFARCGPMPVASDMGDCLFAAYGIRPGDFLAPSYYATMGFGIPAGLGLQAVTGRRPLVLVGDGAFQMTGTELASCRRHGWDPIVVVFDNGGWEMLRAFDEGCPLHDLPPIDFAALAEAMGGDGHTVRTVGALRRALAIAHATPSRFQVIHVCLAPGSVSSTLRRFVAAVSSGRDAAA